MTAGTARARALVAVVLALLAPACTTLRWGATPHRRGAQGTHLKAGSQTGITLNDPGYAGEAVFEYGTIGEAYMLGGRTSAIVRFHGGSPDDGNDDNDSVGVGFGQAVVAGHNLGDRLDVHTGIGYVFTGFKGPRAIVGATLWAITTDGGGGYGLNIELDYYRGSASSETREYTSSHLSLTLGLELGLGEAGFGL